VSRFTIVRIVSVLTGAGVLFALQQGLGTSLYVAIPVAVIVYMLVKVGFGLLWDVDEGVK
jgi:hypothetical protein